MAGVAVSPEYQVVIPKGVREQLGIRPGQKVEAICEANALPDAVRFEASEIELDRLKRVGWHATTPRRRRRRRDGRSRPRASA